MIPPRVDISGFLNELRASLAAARLQPHVFGKEFLMHQRPPYRRCAGERIAYAATDRSAIFEAMRKELDRLGDDVAQRLGAAGRRWVRK